VSPATGEIVEWKTIDPAFAGSTDPVFSPDGQRLAYTRTRDDFSSDLYLARVGADGKPIGPPELLPYGGKEASFPVWTRDGRNLLLIDGVPSSNGGVLRAGWMERVTTARRARHAGSSRSRQLRPPRVSPADRRGHLAARRAMRRPAAASRPRRCGRKAPYSSDGGRLAFRHAPARARSGSRTPLGTRGS
jgi:hypothetical protein